MKDASLDRAALEHAAFRRIELVEAGGQQCLDRRRDGNLTVSRFAHERNHLFDEQRVALGSITDAYPQGRLEIREPLDQQLGLLRAEGLQQNGGCVDFAAGPPHTPVEELGPSQAEQHDRCVS